MTRFIAPLIVSILLLSGCQTTPTANSGTAEEVGKILQEVKASVQGVKDAQAGVIQAQKDLAEGNKTKDQFVSDRVNNADFFNGKNPNPNEQTKLVGNELAPAKAVLPAPSVDSQKQREINLQLALSKTETDKALLQNQYDKLQLEAAGIKGKNEALAEAAIAKEDTLNAKTKELDTTTTKLADKEGEVRIKAAEAEEATNQANRSRAAETRMKIAYGFMALGGLIMLGAIAATFLHVPNVLIAGLGTGGVCLFLGWTLTYVEDLLQHQWFRILAGSVIGCAFAYGAYAIIKGLKTREKAMEDAKIATGAIGALQEVKNEDKLTGANKFAPMASKLNEWFTDDKTGKPDPKIQAAIDKRLVDMNLKSVGPEPKSSQPSPTPVPTPIIS